MRADALLHCTQLLPRQRHEHASVETQPVQVVRAQSFDGWGEVGRCSDNPSVGQGEQERV